MSRPVCKEPAKPTERLKKLRKRMETDQHFTLLVDNMHAAVIDSLAPASWIADAGVIVKAIIERRIYDATQAMPKPGPRPKPGDEQLQ